MRRASAPATAAESGACTCKQQSEESTQACVLPTHAHAQQMLSLSVCVVTRCGSLPRATQDRAARRTTCCGDLKMHCAYARTALASAQAKGTIHVRHANHARMAHDFVCMKVSGQDTWA